MPYLATAVILLGVLCVLNLILLLGVIRRLREVSLVLSEHGLKRQAEPSTLQPGKRPGEFHATTVDGESVAGQDLTLVGFLSQGCRRCHEKLPHLIKAAQETPEGRRGVLVVVVGDSDVANPVDSGARDLARLNEIAQVVVEHRDGPVAAAFQVGGFPAFCRLDPNGIVTANGDKALTTT